MSRPGGGRHHDTDCREIFPEMRARTVRLVREAIGQRIPAYVLMNNRTEGKAPLTIQALVDTLSMSDERGLDDRAQHSES